MSEDTTTVLGVAGDGKTPVSVSLGPDGLQVAGVEGRAPGSQSPIYIAIDNGVSGSIAVLARNGALSTFDPVPTVEQQDYTKTKKRIRRIDAPALERRLEQYSFRLTPPHVFIERPLVNPGRFMATCSALRALEATLIVLERLQLPYQFVDSKQWQKVMLPAGCVKEELKVASMDIGCRLFPQHAAVIRKQKDADSLLMAEWARRAGL